MPRVFQPELPNPVLDVLDVELTPPLQGDDAGGVAQLKLAAAAELGPLELGDHRVFSGGDKDAGSEEIAFSNAALRTIRSAFRAVAVSMTLNWPRRRKASRAVSASA